MMSESDILYENGKYWVCRVRHPKSKNYYYEVIRNMTTHGEVCATIGDGAGPQLGIERAIAECDKRANA